MSAIDELRAKSAGKYNFGRKVVLLADAEQIVSRLEAYGREYIEKTDPLLACNATSIESDAHRCGKCNMCLNEKITAQEQRIGELHKALTDLVQRTIDCDNRYDQGVCGDDPVLMKAKAALENSKLRELEQIAATMCQECAGTGLKSYHATRVTDTCDVCQGSGKIENSKPAADHPEENCLSSECPIHGTAAPSKPAEGTWAWALEQMKAGKRVVRDDQEPYYADDDTIIRGAFTQELAVFDVRDFEATDWQLAEGRD